MKLLILVAIFALLELALPALGVFGMLDQTLYMLASLGVGMALVITLVVITIFTADWVEPALGAKFSGKPLWALLTATRKLKFVVGETKEKIIRLRVFKDAGFGSPNMPGITGFSPIIRDGDGNPTGIPAQISKNFHVGPPWFHGYAELRLPPRSTTECEYTIVYGFWGGAPAVSHSQLCLIGYGGNQLWDQLAVGSWGESICYDADVNLNRSIIDDVILVIRHT